MHDEVVHFIHQFKSSSQAVIEKLFLDGYCYYFAVILQERFGGEILYDTIDGHFVTLIRGGLYDIRGCVSNHYESASYLLTKKSWSNSPRIVEGCILKLD